MRLWMKAVDDYVHPTCGELTFVSCHRHIIRRLGPEGVGAVSLRHARRVGDAAMAVEKAGAGGAGLRGPRHCGENPPAHQVHEAGQRRPGGTPLAGRRRLFPRRRRAGRPTPNRLDMLGMSALWEQGRLPRLADWFDRIKSRPTFKPSFLDWCPPQLTDDLRTFGTQSWPDVRAIIEPAGAAESGAVAR